MTDFDVTEQNAKKCEEQAIREELEEIRFADPKEFKAMCDRSPGCEFFWQDFCEKRAWLKARKAIPSKVARKKLAIGSLQFIASELGKSARQIRRYCEEGKIPGAKRTAGGHWRVSATPSGLAQIRMITIGVTRSKKDYYETYKRQFYSPEEPDRSELSEEQLKYSPKLGNLMRAIRELHEVARDGNLEKVTILTLAAALGRPGQRSSVYRDYSKGNLNGAKAWFKNASFGKYQDWIDKGFRQTHRSSTEDREGK